MNPGFRGFVIQAQSVPGGNLIGTFIPDTVQLQQYLNCPDSMRNVAKVWIINNYVSCLVLTGPLLTAGYSDS